MIIRLVCLLALSSFCLSSPLGQFEKEQEKTGLDVDKIHEERKRESEDVEEEFAGNETQEEVANLRAAYNTSTNETNEVKTEMEINGELSEDLIEGDITSRLRRLRRLRLRRAPGAGAATPLDTEADLPPFLRGLGWRKVEKELRKDMSLVPSIRSISYAIRLNVSVRGYGGATRSTGTISGTIVIALNVTKPAAKIELHSFGLNIKMVFLVTPSTVFELNEIRYNRERETVIITLQETLTPSTDTMLQIEYNGTAVMRGVGLYESWTDPDSTSQDTLPTISLATFCEPTGARRWMPCFDEPDKKASFRLQVTHPTELTAYSNTEGATKVLEGGVSETTFLPTVPLPTYAVALALTKQRAIRREHKGKKLGVIGGNSSFLQELANSMDVIRGNRVFENVTFFPVKTDWLLVDDHFSGAMENPGLITSYPTSNYASNQIHELLHMYFGYLVTLKSWEQMWINEGLTNYFETGGQQDEERRVVSRASMFDAAMHQKFSYSRSQYTTDHLFFFSNEKAGQLLNLIRRFIGEKNFDRAINRYLIDNSYKNGNSEMMIRYLAEENSDARSILEDWVYQPGFALLTVDEENERVIIQQRRFITTDFIKELRDNKTRWMIPLYYTLNGVENWVLMRPGTEKVILEIPLNSTFSIDESYPYLYAVDYINRPASDDLLSHLLKLSNNTVERKYNHELKFDPIEVRNAKNETKMNKRNLMRFCEENARNKSREELWNEYLGQHSLRYLMCDETLKTRDNARRILRELLVTNDLPVRNSDRADMARNINALHPGILLELLAEESTEIDYLDKNLWFAIMLAAKADEGGMEKLRNVIRSNPSFAANAYHKITRTFEDIFFENEFY